MPTARRPAVRMRSKVRWDMVLSTWLVPVLPVPACRRVGPGRRKSAARAGSLAEGGLEGLPLLARQLGLLGLGHLLDPAVVGNGVDEDAVAALAEVLVGRVVHLDPRLGGGEHLADDLG